VLPEDVNSPYQELEFVMLEFNNAFLFSCPGEGFFFEPFDPHAEAALVPVEDLHDFSCLPEKHEIASREYSFWLLFLREYRKAVDLLSHVSDSGYEVNGSIFS